MDLPVGKTMAPLIAVLSAFYVALIAVLGVAAGHLAITAVTSRAELVRSRDRARAWSRLLAIVAIAAGLRLHALTAESFWGDEAITGWLVDAFVSGPDKLRALQTIVANRVSEIHTPTYFMLAAFWASLFGAGDLSLRLAAAVPGTLAVAAAYLVAGRLTDKRVALATAWLTAINVLCVRYSQEARMYSLLQLAGLMSMYGFAGCLQRGRPRDLATYLTATVSAVALHAYGFFLLAIQATYLAIRARAHARLWRHAGIVAVLFAIVTPVFLAGPVREWLVHGRHADLRSTGVVDLILEFVAFASPYWEARDSSWWGPSMIGATCALAVLGLWKLAGRRRCDRTVAVPLLVLAWIGVPLVAAATLSPFVRTGVEYLDYGALRGFLYVVPAFHLLVACGVFVLPGRYTPALVLAGITIGSIPFLHDYYRIDQKPPWREIAAGIDARGSDRTIVVFDPQYQRFAFQRYHDNDRVTVLTSRRGRYGWEAGHGFDRRGMKEVWFLFRTFVEPPEVFMTRGGIRYVKTTETLFVNLVLRHYLVCLDEACNLSVAGEMCCWRGGERGIKVYPTKESFVTGDHECADPATLCDHAALRRRDTCPPQGTGEPGRLCVRRVRYKYEWFDCE